MSEQLTNTGVSGLLAMLGAVPAVNGQTGVVPAGSTLSFGTIMQAQGAGFSPAQLGENGQPLPQPGGILPPSGEMLAQMQAQIDAKNRAPELSQLLVESPGPDLRAALLTENQSLRDGVVMESQWPGVVPESTELSVESPEVVVLMQDAFDGHADAQQRLSEAMSTLQPSPQQLPKENTAPLIEVLPQVVPAGDVALDMKDLLWVAASEEIPATVADVNPLQEQISEQRVSSETDAMVLQQDAEVVNTMVRPNPVAPAGESPESERSELPVLPESRESIQHETVVNTPQRRGEQVVAQEELAIERATTQAATIHHAAETPVIDSQSSATPAAAAIRESQPVRNAGSSQRAVASEAVAGLVSAKDSSSVGGAITQLTTPGQAHVTPAMTQSTPGLVLTQDGIRPQGSTNTAADISEALRQESADSDAPAGSEDGAEGWLRAETRTAGQANAAVDSFSRMTPSQAAFTLAGKGHMGSPAWGQALSERVMVMTAQNNQVAEIQLDPPELGSLKIRLHVGQDQVSVSFTSPHASVRDAVEQSMPRLREMMEEQGLNLGESSVNDQSSESGEDEGGQRFASQGNADGSAGSEETVSTTVSGEAVSLVDYYA